MEFKTKINGRMIMWVTNKKETFAKPCPRKNW